MRHIVFIYFILLQPAFAETKLDCVGIMSSKFGDNTPYPYQKETNLTFEFNGDSVGDLKSKMYDPEVKLISRNSWFRSKHCEFDGDDLQCNKTDPYEKRTYDKLQFDFGNMTFAFNSSWYYEYAKVIVLTWGSGRC